MTLWNELKRRNVIRVAVAYVVTAWLVIQVAETILPLYDIPESAIRTVVTALAVLFIPTVVLAWVFEWTPKGIKKDADIGRDEAISAGNYRAFDRIVIVVLAIAVTYFAVDEFIIEPQPPQTSEQSIAVMPFVNLSPDPAQVLFAGGVTEEVRILLAKIPQLRVTARGSITKVAAMGLDIAEVAAKLYVGHILEGSVRRAGDRIRITAQLIEASSGATLWSESYDETLEDIFEIQDKIAENIVENLHVELVGPLPKARRTDPKALALLIQAKQVFFQNSLQGDYAIIADEMDAYLAKALEIDPGFVDALAWKGHVIGARGLTGEIGPEEYFRRLEQLDEAIRAIDPEHFSIFANRAWIETYNNVDFAAAAPLWERVYPGAVNNGEYLRYIGRFAAYIGRFDIATPLHERAAVIDPLCTSCLYQLSRNYIWAGKWEKAEEARARFLLIGGSSGYFYHGIIKMMLDDAEGALEIFQNSSMNPDGAVAGQAMALYALGRNEESIQQLSRLIEELGEREPRAVAQVYAFRGENDAAFEWLDKSLEQPTNPVTGRAGLIEATVNPLFQYLHDDPRWEQFRMKVGIPTELIESLQFSIDDPN